MTLGRHPELVAAGVGLAGAAACTLADGPRAGVATVLAFAVVGVPAILVARAAGRRRAAFGSVRGRLAFAVAIALAQLFVTTAVFAAVMFFSAHDAVLVAVLVTFCAAVGYVAVAELARAPLAALDAVRDGLDGVAAGRRDVRLAVGGDGELAALAEATNRMVERLAASEDARRSLVAAVSHDLRTPITSLRLLSEGIGDDVVPAHERHEYLGRMRVHLDALSALIDDLFELSRLEAGEIVWSMQASSMVVYGEGGYACARHGAVRPGPRRIENLAAGRFEPPCPRCDRPLDPVPVGEDAPLDPRSVYAATKVHQEHLLACYARESDGVGATALRYHNVYGPRMPRDTPYAGVAAIFRSALERGSEPRVFEDGAQLRDFVAVEDVARATVLALDGPPGTYNVGTGRPRRLLDMARALAAAHPGPAAPRVTGEFRRGDVRHVFAATDRAVSALGYRARTTLEEGMRAFAAAPLR